MSHHHSHHDPHGSLQHSASKRLLHHETVPEGMSCACCWEDITSANYAEYLPQPSVENDFHPHFFPAGYCKDCIEHLLRTQWANYTEALSKTTCKAEQRRLLTRGPPINFRDDKAMPCPGNGEVHKLWYMHENVEKLAKLEYSLEGEERDKYWKEQMQFYAYDEDDEEEDEGKDGSNDEGKDESSSKK